MAVIECSDAGNPGPLCRKTWSLVLTRNGIRVPHISLLRCGATPALNPGLRVTHVSKARRGAPEHSSGDVLTADPSASDRDDKQGSVRVR